MAKKLKTYNALLKDYTNPEDVETAFDEVEKELDNKQDKLTAGDNITIIDNVISATSKETETLWQQKGDNVELKIDAGLRLQTPLEITADKSKPDARVLSVDSTGAIIGNILGHPLASITNSITFFDNDFNPLVKFSPLTKQFTYKDSEIANKDDLATKQDSLVSGTNIKTINNESLLGSGNIDIAGGDTLWEQGTDAKLVTATDVNMQLKQITNLSNGTSTSHAVNKSQLDLKADKSELTNLATKAEVALKQDQLNPTNAGDNITITGSGANIKINATASGGNTLWEVLPSGTLQPIADNNLGLKNQRITSLGEPLLDTDGATKKYVDEHSGTQKTTLELLPNESGRNNADLTETATGYGLRVWDPQFEGGKQVADFGVIESQVAGVEVTDDTLGTTAYIDKFYEKKGGGSGFDENLKNNGSVVDYKVQPADNWYAETSLVTKKYVDEHSGSGDSFWKTTDDPDWIFPANSQGIALPVRGIGLDLGARIKGALTPITDDEVPNKKYVDDKIVSPWIQGEYKHMNYDVTEMPSGWKHITSDLTMKYLVNRSSGVSSRKITLHSGDKGNLPRIEMEHLSDDSRPTTTIFYDDNSPSSEVAFRALKTMLYQYDPANLYSDLLDIIYDDETWKNFEETRQAMIEKYNLAPITLDEILAWTEPKEEQDA